MESFMSCILIAGFVAIIYLLIGFGVSRAIKFQIAHPYGFFHLGRIGNYAMLRILSCLFWPIELGHFIANSSRYYYFETDLHESLNKIVESLVAVVYHTDYIARKLNRLPELSDVITVNNPAFGSESATEKKKASLISLYANHLVNIENIPPEQAYTKAIFIINNFKAESVVNDIIRDNELNNEFKSEEVLRASDFYIKEVEEKAKTLTPQELYKPIYAAIAIKKWEKLTLYQDTHRAFDFYSGKYGYDQFVEDAAIIYRLEQLGILKKSDSLQKSGGFSYKIVKSNLSNVRKIIFGKVSQSDSNYYSDYYFEDKCIREECSEFKGKLPFRTMTSQ